MRCFPHAKGLFRGAFRPAHQTGAAAGWQRLHFCRVSAGLSPRAPDGSRRRVAAFPILPRFRGAFRPAHRTGAAGGGRASAGLFAPRTGREPPVVAAFPILPRFRGAFRPAHRTGAVAGASVSLFCFSYAHLLACCWGLSPPKCLAVSGRAFFRRHAFCAYGCASTADVDDGLRVVFPFGIECEGVH